MLQEKLHEDQQTQRYVYNVQWTWCLYYISQHSSTISMWTDSLILTSYQSAHYVVLCLLSLTKYPQEEMQGGARKQSLEKASLNQLFVSWSSSRFQVWLLFWKKKKKKLMIQVSGRKLGQRQVNFIISVVFHHISFARQPHRKRMQQLVWLSRLHYWVVR